MAMQTGPLNEGDPVSDINTTPLIDVMLVLLIMLIVTLPPRHHAVKWDTPIPCPTCEEAAQHPELIHIDIDFDGSLKWNGADLDVASLDRRLATEARRARQPEIRIEPHRLAKYGHVAHVMATAQREGLTKLAVAGGS
jgi:biopolymer transport protein ExbD